MSVYLAPLDKHHGSCVYTMRTSLGMAELARTYFAYLFFGTRSMVASQTLPAASDTFSVSTLSTWHGRVWQTREHSAE